MKRARKAPLPPAADEPRCTFCRCTELAACRGGCAWWTLAPPVCTRCIDFIFKIPHDKARAICALFAVDPVAIGTPAPIATGGGAW